MGRMGEAQASVLTGDAEVTDVRDGSFFYKDDPLVLLEGTIPEVIIVAGSENVPAGIHVATTLSTIDPDLAVGNIVQGKTIFGKAGTALATTYVLSNSIIWTGSIGNLGTDGTVYTLHKSIDISDLVINQSMRTYFEIQSDLGGSTTYGKVYRNNAPVGTERSAAGGWVSFTEDLTFNDGDDYQIWTKTSTGGDGRESHCRNQTVKGTALTWFSTLL